MGVNIQDLLMRGALTDDPAKPVRLVHRLDKVRVGVGVDVDGWVWPCVCAHITRMLTSAQGVGGVLLLARTRRGASALQGLFRERAVKKTYWAAVKGVPRLQEGE